MVFEQLVGNLINRLRLQALLTDHPEIADIPIERPIIICGLPRTGTTHLHNLMAADPDLRQLSYWESLNRSRRRTSRANRRGGTAARPVWTS
jgi:hypothetical protein